MRRVIRSLVGVSLALSLVAGLAVLAGYRQQNLEPSFMRAGRNLAVLTIAVPTWLLAWWGPAVLLTPVLLRTTWREPRRGLWLALLAGCLAVLEGTTERLLDGGDHSIVLGRVSALAVSDQDGRPGRPLLYYQGRYRQLDADA